MKPEVESGTDGRAVGKEGKPVTASGFRRPALPVVFWLTFCSVELFGGSPPARAQAEATPVRLPPYAEIPVTIEPSGLAAPPPAPKMLDVASTTALGSSREFLPQMVLPDAGARSKTGLFDLFGESMFGNAVDRWRPLPLNTFFSEGWLDPWGKPPGGSSGAPRQGWINALDGLFYRSNFVGFSQFNDFHAKGAAYLGDYTIFTPVSRRFQLRFDVPFVDSNRAGQTDTYRSSFGDVVVYPRVMLSESRDFTQVLSLAVRTPTGTTKTGDGQATLSPQYEFWYGGLPDDWAIRGSTGLVVPANNVGGRTIYRYNLAVGKYWTPHEAVPLGDFVTDVAMKCYTTLDNRGPAYSFLSLTPGVRAHLGNEWYFLGGVEVPLIAPKSQSFAWAPIFVLMKNF